MQLAIGALGALAGGGGGLASAMGIGSTALGVMKGVATAGSLLAGLGASNAQAQAYKDQAAQAQIQKTSEQAQGVQRTTAMKKELLRVVGENDVAFAAAGIDVGSGMAAEAESDAVDDASREISIDRATTDARMSMLDAQSRAYRRMAKSTRSGGLLKFAMGGKAADAGA